MKFSLKILKASFVFFVVAFPVLFITMSFIQGIGQGLQFVALGLTVPFFGLLFWWTKSLLNYILLKDTTKHPDENLLIWLQIIWLFLTVEIPMFLFLTSMIWNRFDRKNPLTNITEQWITVLLLASSVSIITGIICVVYYASKVRKFKLK